VSWILCASVRLTRRNNAVCRRRSVPRVRLRFHQGRGVTDSCVGTSGSSAICRWRAIPVPLAWSLAGARTMQIRKTHGRVCGLGSRKTAALWPPGTGLDCREAAGGEGRTLRGLRGANGERTGWSGRHHWLPVPKSIVCWSAKTVPQPAASYAARLRPRGSRESTKPGRAFPYSGSQNQLGRPDRLRNGHWAKWPRGIGRWPRGGAYTAVALATSAAGRELRRRDTRRMISTRRGSRGGRVGVSNPRITRGSIRPICIFLFPFPCSGLISRCD
jgi:hypothetical protein